MFDTPELDVFCNFLRDYIISLGLIKYSESDFSTVYSTHPASRGAC